MVDLSGPSPFASSLMFDFIASFMYEYDAPVAERRATALTLDRSLLAELLGEPEFRDLLDAADDDLPLVGIFSGGTFPYVADGYEPQPTLAEMARIKAWLLATRLTTRDYLDTVVLCERLGEEGVRSALATLDALEEKARLQSRQLLLQCGRRAV